MSEKEICQADGCGLEWSSFDHLPNDACWATRWGTASAALAQARAELEAVRMGVGRALDPHYSEGGDVVWLANNYVANVRDLQAKLAAVESKLRDKLEGVGTICLIHNSEACAECVADLRKAESQAVKLMRALEFSQSLFAAEMEGMSDAGLPIEQSVAKRGFDEASRVLASLPASVQARAEREAVPAPMVLYCPAGHQHIDEGEWATKPHKTHQCQHRDWGYRPIREWEPDGPAVPGGRLVWRQDDACGKEWRPADFPTVGVARLAALDSAQKGEGR